MHLDKKLITIIVSSALIGGIIGGGIGGAIGSFAGGHERGGKEGGRKGSQRMMGWNNSYYGDYQEAYGDKNGAPQTAQATNPVQQQALTASTTKAK